MRFRFLMDPPSPPKRSSTRREEKSPGQFSSSARVEKLLFARARDGSSRGQALLFDISTKESVLRAQVRDVACVLCGIIGQCSVCGRAGIPELDGAGTEPGEHFRQPRITGCSRQEACQQGKVRKRGQSRVLSPFWILTYSRLGTAESPTPLDRVAQRFPTASALATEVPLHRAASPGSASA